LRANWPISRRRKRRALHRDYGESSTRGHSNPGVFVVHERYDGVDGQSDFVSGDHLGGHFAHSPMLVPSRRDDRVGGAVVPDVEESARGPCARPVAVDAPGATFENHVGGRSAQYTEELWIDGL
jgi:hypothetical protein